MIQEVAKCQSNCWILQSIYPSVDPSIYQQRINNLLYMYIYIYMSLCLYLYMSMYIIMLVDHCLSWSITYFVKINLSIQHQSILVKTTKSSCFLQTISLPIPLCTSMLAFRMVHIARRTCDQKIFDSHAKHTKGSTKLYLKLHLRIS